MKGVIVFFVGGSDEFDAGEGIAAGGEVLVGFALGFGCISPFFHVQLNIM